MLTDQWTLIDSSLVPALDRSFLIPLGTYKFCNTSPQYNLPGMPSRTLHCSLFKTWIIMACLFYNAMILSSLLWNLVHCTYLDLQRQLSQTHCRWCHLSTLGLVKTSGTKVLYHSGHQNNWIQKVNFLTRKFFHWLDTPDSKDECVKVYQATMDAVLHKMKFDSTFV